MTRKPACDPYMTQNPSVYAPETRPGNKKAECGSGLMCDKNKVPQIFRLTLINPINRLMHMNSRTMVNGKPVDTAMA